MMSITTLDYATIKALAHPIRWRIIQELKERPVYGKKLAQILNISEQKVYHHLKILEKASIIKIQRLETRKGALIKYFTLNHDELRFILKDSQWQEPLAPDSILIARMLSTTLTVSKTNSFRIIVGNPEPHGPYNAISRDGYLSSLLSWTLRRYVPTHLRLDVMTDSEFLDRHPNFFSALDAPVISMGGPITNVVTKEILDILKRKKIPIRITGPPWMIKTAEASYQERTCGIILLFNDRGVFSRPVIIFAGIGRRGTMASILSLEQVSLNSDLLQKRWWCVIVQGYPHQGKKASDIRYAKVLDILHS